MAAATARKRTARKPVEVKPAGSRSKRPAKKVAAKKTATRKTAAKKATPKKTAVRKVAAKKTTAKSAVKRTREPWGEFDAHGFRIGSDSAIIAETVMEGGLSRNDVNARVASLVEAETRSGTPKNVPSLVSGLIRKLEEKGYTVESSWRLVPPANVKKAPAAKKTAARTVKRARRVQKGK